MSIFPRNLYFILKSFNLTFSFDHETFKQVVLNSIFDVFKV